MKLEVHQLSQKLYEVEIPALDLVNGAEIFIGRADDCHVVLEDQQVSRHHALLTFKEGKLRLQKLSEFGSVVVNGNEVSDWPLGEGDKFSITDYNLLVNELPEAGAESAEASADEDVEGPVMDSKTEQELDEMIAEEPPAEETAAQASAEATEILDSLEGESEEAEEEAFNELENDGQDEGFDAASDMADMEEESFDSPEMNEESPVESEDAFQAGGDDSFGEEEGFGDDAGFGDDGFGGEDDAGFGDGAGESTQVFQSFASYFLEIDGERAPFDKYKIEDREILIGRDPEKCQIVLNDPEVSGVHAIIKKTLINCFIEDQNSSNGTVYNGERVNKAELSNNDNFQIGSTIFTVKIVSDLIENEKETLMPVEDGQEIEVEEVVEEEVDYDDLVPDGAGEFSMEEPEEKSLVKKLLKNPKRAMMYGGVGLLLLIFLLPSEDGNKKAVKKSAKEATKKEAPKKAADPNKKSLSPEVIARLEENYALALAKYEAGEYYEAKEYLEVIRGIDPKYKDTETLHKLVKQGHEELLRLKAEEEAEKERKKRQIKIQALLKKAKDAVKNREVAVAESLFGQVLELDPENIDIPQLKLELDAYKDEQRRKKEEAARKKALRKAMVDALQPGKTLFLKGDWYKAIDRLEKFTGKKGMDEDLIKEATDMLMKSRKNLSGQINPLLGRARSFKEGQDLKRAYETYGEVLRFDPSNEEALNERALIKETLRTRSMKIYRDALISESLSLFDEAKEKFEEVQQISPVNSEYYNKATERLKNYLE